MNSATNLTKTKTAQSRDLNSHRYAVLGLLTMADPAEMSNKELHEAILAAESFAVRGREYLASVEDYQQRIPHGMAETVE